MSLLVLVCFVLAALDAATMMLELSFTSVGWSPVIVVLLGGLFLTLDSCSRATGPAPEIPGADRPGVTSADGVLGSRFGVPAC